MVLAVDIERSHASCALVRSGSIVFRNDGAGQRGGQSRTVTIDVPLISIEKATITDAVERDQKPLTPYNAHSFNISVQPHQIIAVRLNEK